ncbi:MAG: hypothetical protein Q9217_003612 [Psora testacea]
MPPSQPSTHVTLVSSDGFEFIVKREAACVAGTIKKMLDPQSNFAEAVTGRCTLSTINWERKADDCARKLMGKNSSIVLEKVCEYLYYNLKYKDVKDVPDMEIPPELCLELGWITQALFVARGGLLQWDKKNRAARPGIWEGARLKG